MTDYSPILSLTSLIILAFFIAPMLREISDKLSDIKKRLDAEEYRRRTEDKQQPGGPA